MPRMRWTVLLGVLLACAQWATADELMPIGGDCPCRAKTAAAGVCCLAPGCCEARRHCFDNAWDGYCQERTRWDTFCHNLGTGAYLPCEPCSTCGWRSAARTARVCPASSECGCQGSN